MHPNMSRGIKRGIDVSGALAGLTLLSIPMGLAWVLVRFTLGPPAILRQVRPGRGGATFPMMKFRTMTESRSADGALLPDDQRLTALGRFLRRTSIDELPELINVVRGDMSLVGPRPLLVRYLDRYTPEQARRHDVRPGLTGWAQVNGRNALSWEEKFALDVWYVDNWTVTLDLKIIGLTVMRVVRGHGVSARDHATMPEFMGTDPPASGGEPHPG